jgi:hypothetical protein
MVDGMARGAAMDRDLHGRPLPSWQVYRLLTQGEIFLMNEQSRDSLVGRGRIRSRWTDPAFDQPRVGALADDPSVQIGGDPEPRMMAGDAKRD